MYVRFLSPEDRQDFYTAYKDLEALWEILSPSAELYDYISPFQRLAKLYAAVRVAYSNQPGFVADLAHKTQRLVGDSATMHGLGNLTKSVTFDLQTLAALRKESGSDEAKVFNLIRGFQTEVERETDLEAVLRPLKERAEQILKGLEERTTTGLAAMDLLEAIARDKEDAEAAAKNSALPPKAFSVYWTLKDDEALQAAGVDAVDFAQEAQTLVGRFPNAAVNTEEQRRLRASLYFPLLKVESGDRSRIVEHTLAILLSGATDADS